MPLSLWLANVLQIDKIRVLDSIVPLRWGRRYGDWYWCRQRLDLVNFLQNLRSFVFENLPEVVVHVGVIIRGYSMTARRVHISSITLSRIVMVYLPKLYGLYLPASTDLTFVMSSCIWGWSADWSWDCCSYFLFLSLILRLPQLNCCWSSALWSTTKIS